MRNAGLEETQAGIKITGRNINTHHSDIFYLLEKVQYTHRGKDTTRIKFQEARINASHEVTIIDSCCVLVYQLGIMRPVPRWC